MSICGMLLNSRSHGINFIENNIAGKICLGIMGGCGSNQWGIDKRVRKNPIGKMKAVN
jgi:hypothetical protein